jgi:hypothetical protein
MVWVGVGVEENHRQSLRSGHTRFQPSQLLGVQGLDLLSLRTDPPADANPVPPSDQGLWPVPHQGIQLGPILTADFHHILEPPIGDEDHAGALPLQEAVGGHGGAMEKTVWPGIVQQLPGSGQHGLRRVPRCGRDLQSSEDTVGQEEEVREGASGIHGKNGG